ncbi:4-hydroxy-3-methylbut-2-enyl diphosphate reductase [uncultured Jatrophihabitans sp.]|uniref:4-hydroxy-3-methylbut-2-enyl diphosphate reductase n=1 Tax=uncultured Jatrophihabitans sp. TaxID=1610747 RepID=UPI0035CA694D
MSGPPLVIAALRSEYTALAGQVSGAELVRCGMGAARAIRWGEQLGQRDPSAVVIAGVAGGLDPAIRSGDIVVADEVRDAHGRTLLRGAAPLVAALRAQGFRVHSGPVHCSEHIVDDRAERERLAATGALAVDLESAALVRAADGRPTAVVRVIVDPAYGRLASLRTVPAGAWALGVLHNLGPALVQWAELVRPRKVVLAGPRSFCAGVDRAIDIVETALQRFPRPIYVRRQIVHNAHVVRDLEAQGAVFVDELDEVPDGTTLVFSAHGVSPAVRTEAARRDLTVIDATCPLVAKVHVEARRFASRGDAVVLIGHEGHDETEGTMGEAPERIHLVQNAADAEALELRDGDRVAYVMQTTLAADDAADTIDVLRRRFPGIESSASDDICYATTNRQHAVQAIAAESDVVVVLGSTNSSNSQRLVEVAERSGARAHLVDDATGLRPEWLAGASTIGLTAGASAPPHLVDEVVGTLRAIGGVEVVERTVADEKIMFTLPKEVAG